MRIDEYLAVRRECNFEAALERALETDCDEVMQRALAAYDEAAPRKEAPGEELLRLTQVYHEVLGVKLTFNIERQRFERALEELANRLTLTAQQAEPDLVRNQANRAGFLEAMAAEGLSISPHTVLQEMETARYTCNKTLEYLRRRMDALEAVLK